MVEDNFVLGYRGDRFKGDELRVGDYVKRINNIHSFSNYIYSHYGIKITKFTKIKIIDIDGFEDIRVSVNGKDIGISWCSENFELIKYKQKTIKFEDYKKCEQYV